MRDLLLKNPKQSDLADTFFNRWKQRGCRTVSAMNAKLRSDFNEPNAHKREQLKLKWLREQARSLSHFVLPSPIS